MNHVDRNQLVPNIEFSEDSVGAFGIPLRLEIAARIIAHAAASVPLNQLAKSAFYTDALMIADNLIDTHNETCEDINGR